LHVVFTATGDAVSYHWDFGDGAAADLPTVEHVYGPGAFTARLTARSATGETATSAIRVRSFALTLKGRSVIGYGGHVRFRGRLVPALRGVRVGIFGADGRRAASGLTRRNGSFRIGVPVRAPSTYVARFGGAASRAIPVRVRPRLGVRFIGAGVVGRPLRLAIRLRPTAAGPVHVDVWRGRRHLVGGTYADRARIRLPSSRAAAYRIRLATKPAPGYAASRVIVRKIVYFPRLSLSSHGPSVLALNQALARLHIALGAVDSSYGTDTRDAVVTFQKLHGLPRTGAVDGRVWRYLVVAHAPRPRYPYGNHIEISKPLQVLFVVRRGKVLLASHVSTGATGNTPVGRWRVYSKVRGWLASGMFDSSFFLRGFAIHGYPVVPFYPASHGCVRLPVWVAPRVYALAPYGTSVYIY
jgi:PKD repeat protein